MADEIERRDIHHTEVHPRSTHEQTIASFTAEQTAAFFRGEPLPRPTWHDPETARKMDEQRERLRRALEYSVPLFVEALQSHSKQSAHRLEVLANGALAGDPYKVQLFMAMYGELVLQAVRP